jgi:hypothetical protein
MWPLSVGMWLQGRVSLFASKFNFLQSGVHLHVINMA